MTRLPQAVQLWCRHFSNLLAEAQIQFLLSTNVQLQETVWNLLQALELRQENSSYKAFPGFMNKVMSKSWLHLVPGLSRHHHLSSPSALQIFPNRDGKSHRLLGSDQQHLSCNEWEHLDPRLWYCYCNPRACTEDQGPKCVSFTVFGSEDAPWEWCF